MTFDPMLAIGPLVIGLFSAFLGLLLLTILQTKAGKTRESVFLETSGTAEYLFDGKTLVDVTPAGRSLLPRACHRDATVWPGLMSFLEQRFPGVESRLETLATDGTVTLSSADDEESEPLLLRAEIRGGLTRISLHEANTRQSSRALDPLTRRAIKDELDQLRLITGKAPLPIWRESDAGDVIWANANYLELAADRLGEDEDLTWPLPKLFSRPDVPDLANGRRQKLASRTGEKDLWFDLHEFKEATGGVNYALPADKAVRAEEGLRAFMQTLTKTFAHLSIGLAIFDQDRRLVLFNPALIDLSGLTPDMLTKRPSLPTFFDAMRDNSMIPEPRDYKSWRNQITDIEEAAASGHYEETWTLPSGQTYRVVGRPHPNGALALSFEDISNEMSQTRRYRADLELGQAVIDAVDAAIAVFSASGVMVMSNAAYASLWGHDPAASLGGEGTVTTVCDYWRRATAPSTLWDRVEDFSAEMGTRSAWQDDARLEDGRLVHCRFAPLAGGATMATFRLDPAEGAEQVPSFSSTRKRA